MYKIIILSLISLTIQAQTTLKLEDCIDLAIKNNFQIKQAEMQAELGVNQYNQTKFSQLPSVSGMFNQGYNLGRTIDPYSNDVVTNQIGTNNVGIRADWMVFNGFQNKKQLEAQVLQIKANKYDIEVAKNTIKLNIMLAYMQVLSAGELVEVAHNQAITTKIQIEKVEKLIRLNVIPESNLYDLKAQLANDEFQIINAKNNFRTAKLQLIQLLNWPTDKNIEFEKISLENLDISKSEITQKEVFEMAKSTFPEIKTAETKIMVYRKNLEVINAMKYPTITLGGAWGTSYSSAAKKPIIGNEIKEFPTNSFINIGSNKIPVMQLSPDVSTQKINYFSQLGNNNNLAFGLNIRVPIFNTTQQKYKIENVKIQEKIAKNEAENSKMQLHQSIEQAFIHRDNAAEKYLALQNQLISTEKALQVAEVKLSSGFINPIDYNITKTNFDKAKINVIQAKFEYYFRLKILDFYQGK